MSQPKSILKTADNLGFDSTEYPAQEDFARSFWLDHRWLDYRWLEQDNQDKTASEQRFANRLLNVWVQSLLNLIIDSEPLTKR